MASDAYDKVLTMVDSTVNNAWQLLNHLQLYSRDNQKDDRSNEMKQSMQKEETIGGSAALPSSQKQSSKTKVQQDGSSGPPRIPTDVQPPHDYRRRSLGQQLETTTPSNHPNTDEGIPTGSSANEGVPDPLGWKASTDKKSSAYSTISSDACHTASFVSSKSRSAHTPPYSMRDLDGYSQVSDKTSDSVTRSKRVRIGNEGNDGVTIMHAENIYINCDSEEISDVERTEPTARISAGSDAPKPRKPTPAKKSSRRRSSSRTENLPTVVIKNSRTGVVEVTSSQMSETKQSDPRQRKDRFSPRDQSTATQEARSTTSTKQPQAVLSTLPSSSKQAEQGRPENTPGRDSIVLKRDSKPCKTPPGLKKSSKPPPGAKTYIKETLEKTETTTYTEHEPGKPPVQKRDVKKTTTVNYYPDSDEWGDLPRQVITEHTITTTDDETGEPKVTEKTVVTERPLPGEKPAKLGQPATPMDEAPAKQSPSMKKTVLQGVPCGAALAGQPSSARTAAQQGLKTALSKQAPIRQPPLIKKSAPKATSPKRLPPRDEDLLPPKDPYRPPKDQHGKRKTSPSSSSEPSCKLIRDRSYSLRKALLENVPQLPLGGQRYLPQPKDPYRPRKSLRPKRIPRIVSVPAPESTSYSMPKTHKVHAKMEKKTKTTRKDSVSSSSESSSSMKKPRKARIPKKAESPKKSEEVPEKGSEESLSSSLKKPKKVRLSRPTKSAKKAQNISETESEESPSTSLKKPKKARTPKKTKSAKKAENVPEKDSAESPSSSLKKLRKASQLKKPKHPKKAEKIQEKDSAESPSSSLKKPKKARMPKKTRSPKKAVKIPEKESAVEEGSTESPSSSLKQPKKATAPRKAKYPQKDDIPKEGSVSASSESPSTSLKQPKRTTTATKPRTKATSPKKAKSPRKAKTPKKEKTPKRSPPKFLTPWGELSAEASVEPPSDKSAKKKKKTPTQPSSSMGRPIQRLSPPRKKKKKKAFPELRKSGSYLDLQLKQYGVAGRKIKRTPVADQKDKIRQSRENIKQSRKEMRQKDEEKRTAKTFVNPAAPHRDRMRSDKTQDSPHRPLPSSTSTGTLPSEDSSLRPPLGSTSTGTLPSEDSSLKKPAPAEMRTTSTQQPTEKKSTVSDQPKFIFKVHHPRRKKVKPSRPKDTDQQSTSARGPPSSTSTGTLPSEDSSLKKLVAETTTTSTQRPTEKTSTASDQPKFIFKVHHPRRKKVKPSRPKDTDQQSTSARGPPGSTSTGTLPSEDSSLKKLVAETTTTSTQRPTEKTSTAPDQPKFIFKVHHPRPKKVKPSNQQHATKPGTSRVPKFIFTPVRSPPKPGKRITRVEKKKRKKKKEKFLPATESESYLEHMNKYAVAGRKIKRTTTNIEQIRERRENIKASREAMKAMDEENKILRYSTAQQNISPAPLRPAGKFYSASDCFGLGKNYKRREPREITHSWHHKIHKDFHPPEKSESYLDLVLSRRGRRHPKGEDGETAGAPPTSNISTKTTQPITTPRDEQKRTVDYFTTPPDSSEKGVPRTSSTESKSSPPKNEGEVSSTKTATEPPSSRRSSTVPSVKTATGTQSARTAIVDQSSKTATRTPLSGAVAKCPSMLTDDYGTPPKRSVERVPSTRTAISILSTRTGRTATSTPPRTAKRAPARVPSTKTASSISATRTAMKDFSTKTATEAPTASTASDMPAFPKKTPPELTFSMTSPGHSASGVTPVESRLETPPAVDEPKYEEKPSKKSGSAVAIEMPERDPTAPKYTLPAKPCRGICTKPSPDANGMHFDAKFEVKDVDTGINHKLLISCYFIGKTLQNLSLNGRPFRI